jgi:uncharacterized membrane protein YraQ (UPF0718 family)
MQTIQTIVGYLIALFEPLRGTWVWPGIAEAGKFLGTHLLSGMIPAFFIAGAISIFLDKQRITRLMGADANPLVSYPVAAASGGILTVCSCGVIPIFTSILQQGAGIGPAFTFLFSSPAVNLIALSYTYTLMGEHFLIGRTVAVVLSSILIGLLMRAFFGKGASELPPADVVVMPDDDHSDGELLCFFALLVVFMILATGVLDKYVFSFLAYINIKGTILPRVTALAVVLLAIVAFTAKYFTRGEIRLWLKKSYDLFVMIFPKVFLGIFICGCLAAFLPLTDYMAYFESNDVLGNLVAAVIGAVMYFGTIVGVTIVTTLKDFGMHGGPAMTLLLSGPAVSLPSVIALVPIVGAKKAFTFLAVVVIISALSGFVFGLTF